MSDEITLLKKLKKKQQSALVEAMKLYTPYISVVLFNFCGGRLSHEDTEEILSDAFAALWKNAESLDLGKGSIRSYLAGTVRNMAAMKLRKKTADTVGIDDTVLYSDDEALEHVITDDTSMLIWKAVMQLGEPDSEIFVRYYKYGEKLRHIARTLNLNISTVKTKLARGRKKLKRILSEEGLS